ncbi:MAG: hypothetical protein GXO23_03400 [Crenarchaeota archaeon]|nr:hypothetical protein [Thermoproteota archaeon]
MSSIVAKGLIAITRDHGVRSLSIVYGKNLFTIQDIAGTQYVALVKQGYTRVLENVEKYVILLRAFISIMNIVSDMTQSRYYTFLGEFKYNFRKKRLRYEPYVDLMKKATVRISTRTVNISSGEISKKLKKSKSGYTPELIIETFEEILRSMTDNEVR